MQTQDPQSPLDNSSNLGLLQGLEVGLLLVLIINILTVFRDYRKNSNKTNIDRTYKINKKQEYGNQLENIINQKSITPSPAKPQIKAQQYHSLNDGPIVNVGKNLMSGEITFGVDNFSKQDGDISTNQTSLQVKIEENRTEPLRMSKRQKIREELQQMMNDVYAARHSLEIVKQDDSKKIILRKRQIDEERAQILMEMEVQGIKPAQLYYLFEHIQETQLDWNIHCAKCEAITNEDGNDIYVTYIKKPAFFMDGRLFIDARYLFDLNEKGEYMALFSSLGNEDLIEQYISTNDVSGYVVSKSIISGHWYMPMLNSKGDVIGTKIFYLNESSFGGKVPEFIAKQFVPKAVLDTYDALTKAARKIVV